jgi:hypothetical protein
LFGVELCLFYEESPYTQMYFIPTSGIPIRLPLSLVIATETFYLEFSTEGCAIISAQLINSLFTSVCVHLQFSSVVNHTFFFPIYRHLSRRLRDVLNDISIFAAESSTPSVLLKVRAYPLAHLLFVHLSVSTRSIVPNSVVYSEGYSPDDRGTCDSRER